MGKRPWVTRNRSFLSGFHFAELATAPSSQLDAFSTAKVVSHFAGKRYSGLAPIFRGQMSRSATAISDQWNRDVVADSLEMAVDP